MNKGVMTDSEFETLCSRIKRFSPASVNVLKSILVEGETQAEAVRRTGMSKQTVSRLVIKALAASRTPEREKANRKSPATHRLPTLSENEEALLGTMPDPAVATLTGKNLKTIQSIRAAHGTPAYVYPLTQNTFSLAASFQNQAWPEWLAMSQRDFFICIADEYQKATGVPLNYRALSLLGLWSVDELRQWFEPSDAPVQLPSHTRHHIWLVVKVTVAIMSSN